MLDVERLRAVAISLMDKGKSEAQDPGLKVSRTGQQKLRTASFLMHGRRYEAIEQNATKPSRWGQLARDGHQVVQFKDAETDRYVAVAVDGKIIEYGEK